MDRLSLDMKALSLIALLIVGVCVGGAFAQDCCDFTLLRRDTVLKQSSISVIEVPPGKQAVLKFEPVPEIVVIREDFTAIGSWTHAKNTTDPFLNQTVSFSNTKEDFLFLNWYGKKIELITSTASHHGDAIIQVNQGPEKVVSLKSATRNDGVIVFEYTAATAGTNTIKVKVAGNGYVVIDYFRVSE